MKHLRGFEIDVLPATNTKGRRVKIYDTRHEVRHIVSWDYSEDTSLDIAQNYLVSVGIKPVAFTYNEKSHQYTILSEDFETPLKEVA